MMAAPSFEDRRCAIAVNNIGCLLLEKNCHRQAQATFQDALEFLSESSRAEVDERNKSGFKTLHDGELRLSHPDVTSSTLPAFKSVSYSLSSPSLDCILRSGSTALHFPVRVDVFDAEDLAITTEALACIILLNFAISCRSMALLSSASGQQSRDSILRILTHVHVLLDHYDDGSAHWLLLLLVSLDTTVKVLMEVGKVGEAGQLESRLQTLRSHATAELSLLLAHQQAARAA